MALLCLQSCQTQVAHVVDSAFSPSTQVGAGSPSEEEAWVTMATGAVAVEIGGVRVEGERGGEDSPGSERCLSS